MRAVIFDMGDTLVDYGEIDWKAGHQYVLSRSRSAKRVSQEEFTELAERIWARVGRSCTETNLEYHSRQYYNLLSAWFGLHFEESIDELDFGRLMAASRPKLMPHAEQTLRALQAGGFKLGLLGNAPMSGETAGMILRKLGILDAFDFLALSGDFGIRKPDPVVFLATARALSVGASETLMVGDQLDTDVIGAKAVGMKAVWYNSMGKANDSQAAPDYVIEDLLELVEIVGVS